MKNFGFLITLCSALLLSAQNITVDGEIFSPQELIEDILIDSDCIQNVVVTNVVTGNFSTNDLSYGYFDASGTNFPFQSGIVMSTGRLANVPGPNNNLSDDDAPNWSGDNDLEMALNESNTFNATIIEFDFTSFASQISFNYIFASEEYQENNPNSCQFSDLFGFLIRPTGSQDPYENIALVPNTNTPVKATTVTPGVPGSCPPQNETYFGSYNSANAPINFNGQTAVLTATAIVEPNISYHVKLVIADEQNFRFDSAVFLEAGSFQLTTDLGPDRLIATENPLCEGESLTLNAFQQGASYLWFKDSVPESPFPCFDCPTYEVTEAGVYSLELFLGNNCLSFGDVIIEYAPLPLGSDAVLTECDLDTDGLTTFNLNNATNTILQNAPSAQITDFFLTEAEALANQNPIDNANTFENELPSQTVFARLINQSGCFDVVSLQLQTSNNSLDIPALNACDDAVADGFVLFDLSDIEASIINQIPTGSNLSYHLNEADARNGTNALPDLFENTLAGSQTIFVKITNNGQCFSIATVVLNVLEAPLLEADETVFYCLNTFPETLRLFGGVLNDLPNNYLYEWSFNGTITEVSTSFYDSNEIGNYTVTVINTNGCSSNRTISVLPSTIGTISSVTVEGIAPNNTISVMVSGEGNYVYAIDEPNGFYQESPVFTNIDAGVRTIYVRDINGCGTIEESISVLGFPKFFTPNGDNVNDTWRIIGGDIQSDQIESVQIFNRYGKLMAQQNRIGSGWDGTLNGQDLPSDDYWFVAKFLDGMTYTGHFALKR